MRLLPFLFCLLLLAAPLASAPVLAKENLIASIPQDYKPGFHNQKDNMTIDEYVTGGETVENWTELVTVQVFSGMKGVTPDAFRERMDVLWAKACPGGTSQPIASAAEHGYRTAMWMMNCPTNPQTGKQEITWFKALAGNDSFYVVQKAFKFQPSQEQVAPWVAWLGRVSLCDTRLPGRTCPAGMK
jgi:hypothetical protein